ncbi:hypothetical protein FO519_004313 [Halicephalobus sp. NKZ332]|nr:hypothetical protein FO519_004313 [Halicephalobus sp. NKZ332]
MDKRLRVQITEQELLCKNKCGFYGTPQWNGLCSKCWRQSQSQQKRKIDHNRNRQSVADVPGTHPKLYTYIFDNFGSSTAKEIDKLCHYVLEKVFQNARLTLDEISEIIQHDYQVLKEKVSKFRPIKDDFNINTFMSEFEEYVCTNAYDVIFSDRADEEAADLSMQDRIRSLNWVTSGFLETAFDFSILAVHKYVDEAVTYIIDLNQYRSVREKLDCLVNCSKTIFTALKESRAGAPASADEFLPGLIYVILRANPPLILSNMKFISRFALPSRIMRGESGYYFTNLSCALQFIQDMNADSLHMDKEEFEAYTSGRLAVPLRNYEPGRNLAIKAVENGLKMFDALLTEQSQLSEAMNSVGKLMDHNCQCYEEEIDNLLKQHPSADVLEFCKTLHDPNSLDLSVSLSSAKASPQLSAGKNEKLSEIPIGENLTKPIPVDSCETQSSDGFRNDDANITPKDLATDARTEPEDSANGDETFGEALSVLSNNTKELS